VMKFDGTNWVNVGTAGFSAGEAEFISLAFSPFDGQPYVAYSDGAKTDKATVMKFDGSNWINIGNTGFSAGMALYTSLTFSQSGEPFLAYRDGGNSYNATVMRFDGINWENVGNSGFSAGPVGFTSLAFNTSGQLYVAYEDYANSNKATVMKYDSVFVGINQQQEINLSFYPNPATDKITLEISGETGESILVIVNIEGKEVIKQKITSRKTLVDISSLNSGVYFIRLTNDRTVEVGKIIKQ